MKTKTFTIIKPNAVADGNTGKIIDKIIEAGFTIRAMKMLFMSRNDAARFYAVHTGQPFFDYLVQFMTSGPVVVAVLEREDAVPALRELVGNTDPEKAQPGTIRRLFGETVSRNAIHASDSDENARCEWEHFFTEQEVVVTDYRQP